MHSRVGLKRVQNRYQPIGKRGLLKIYVHQSGGSFFTNFLKNLGKKFLTVGKQNAKNILLPVAKNLAQTAVTYGSNKVLEEASRRGVPDSFINTASPYTQKLGKLVGDQFDGLNNEKQTEQQKMISNLINNKSQKILNDLIKQNGSGIRNL